VGEGAVWKFLRVGAKLNWPADGMKPARFTRPAKTLAGKTKAAQVNT
jgi:hypothetical protein